MVLPVLEPTKIEFVVNVARATQGSARTQLCPRGHFRQVRKGSRG
jgi:hypothetical protein